MATGNPAYDPAIAGSSSLTPPATIDGTGLTTSVPLLVKNAKAGSGIELQVTGTARTGYVLLDSGGTARGVFGYAVSANDWLTGSAAGDVVLAGDPTKLIRAGGVAAASPSVTLDLANSRLGIGTGAGAITPANRLVVDNGGIAFTGSEAFSGTNSGLYGSSSTLKVQCAGVDRLTIASSDFTWRLPTTTLLALGTANSLTAVALQINGDPNTGAAQIGGADTISLVAGGNETVRVTLAGLLATNASSTTLWSFKTGAASGNSTLAVTGASDGTVNVRGYGSTAGSTTMGIANATCAFVEFTGQGAGAVGGMYTLGTKDLVFGTNATERFRIDNANTALLLAEAFNLAAGATTGTKIGTATTQKLGFWNATPVVQPTNGVNLTNNVTSGGTDDTIANYTDLTLYANDSAAIRNNIYQLAKKLKVVNDALRTIGLMS